MRICVDAGHGGTDPGAIGRNPFMLREKDFNLDLALKLEDALGASAHDVIMVRRTDRTFSLAGRANFANTYGADLFISIHANAAASESAEGMEVFHFPGSDQGRQVARQILDRMLNTFHGHTNRGVKEANFAVLRLTRMPAVLVECEFLTHPDQLQFLADEDNQRKLAAAIASGVPEHL